ncbi:MAG: aminoglycoside 6'-N-acetyltransferase I [Cellvibrionaceae bacterium]|jgi:aminoglycoside 6'-N-acetyltransferase I
MRIIDLNPHDSERVEQAAEALVVAFAEHYPDTWDTLEEARVEVAECLAPEMIFRMMLDDNGQVLGWIGGRPEYDGHVWEMHPLAVRPDVQGQGIGRALVADLEEQVRQKGGLTIMLGADDVSNQTSLGGIDIYPNVLDKLGKIKNLKRHPFEFYEKCGYTITGIMPDANGFGKPDIFMTKRVKQA